MRTVSLPSEANVEAAVPWLLDSLPHPVLVLNETSSVMHANAAAAGCWGHGLVGRSLQQLFPGEVDLLPLVPANGKPRIWTCRSQQRYLAMVGKPDAHGTAVSFFPAGDDAGFSREEDELTGLPTRNGLNARLESLVRTGGATHCALHCIDLDRFKIVNDTLGHGVGDLLLRKVADRLRSVCRSQHEAIHVAGDEFVVLQTGLTTPDDAERFAARIVDLLSRTYVFGGHTINVSASVGVALVEPGLAARDVLRNGDLAVEEAKRAGRGRFRVFEPGMDAALRTRREMEIELRRALALKQFDLHYQPFLDLQSDKVIGFEALIRWEHPTRGRISPAEFIPIAEEIGLIVKIGEWVLRTACVTAAAWSDDIAVAVNVSPVQFQSDGLVDLVLSALQQSGLPPHRLEIEITEGALLDNTDNVLRTLHTLRDLGVQISMDDFGTGYSSLSYLQKFPFHKIKIDRSFVQGAEAGGDSEAILKAIAGLGLSLGMSITAEGVETAEQLDRIRSERCTHVQGYLTGRPMPASDVSDFLS